MYLRLWVWAKNTVLGTLSLRTQNTCTGDKSLCTWNFEFDRRKSLYWGLCELLRFFLVSGSRKAVTIKTHCDQCSYQLRSIRFECSSVHSVAPSNFSRSFNILNIFFLDILTILSERMRFMCVFRVYSSWKDWYQWYVSIRNIYLLQSCMSFVYNTTFSIRNDGRYLLICRVLQGTCLLRPAAHQPYTRFPSLVRVVRL